MGLCQKGKKEREGKRIKEKERKGKEEKTRKRTSYIAMEQKHINPSLSISYKAKADLPSHALGFIPWPVRGCSNLPACLPTQVANCLGCGKIFDCRTTSNDVIRFLGCRTISNDVIRFLGHAGRLQAASGAGIVLGSI
eukprot:1161949-Pelagomonas_calceolata.AAC.4